MAHQDNQPFVIQYPRIVSNVDNSGVHEVFRDEEDRKDFISKVLLITAGRVIAFFLTIILFEACLSPRSGGSGALILSIATPLYLGTFLSFIFSRKARVSFPLNAYLTSANLLGCCLLVAYSVHTMMIEFEHMSMMNPRLLPCLVKASLALLIADMVAIIALVRNSVFDVSCCCSISWQTVLTILTVHIILGTISEASTHGSLVYSLALSIPCMITCLFVLLVVRSILLLGWLGPKDYVAASIYADDPFIYFISLCTEVKRPINQPQQVTQPPVDTPIYTQSPFSPIYDQLNTGQPSVEILSK